MACQNPPHGDSPFRLQKYHEKYVTGLAEIKTFPFLSI